MNLNSSSNSSSNSSLNSSSNSQTLPLKPPSNSSLNSSSQTLPSNPPLNSSLSPSLKQHYINSFDSVYIHPDSESSRVAKRFRKEFPDKIKVFSERKEVKTQTLSPEDFDQSKREILIQPHKGNFFKQCPGGNANSVCCNYFVLNLGSQCHFNCSYCYLQSFLNTPFMVIYSNIDQAVEELIAVAKSMNGHGHIVMVMVIVMIMVILMSWSYLRVGTGETIDSLGLDPLTGYTELLIEALKKCPNVNLELKTKSNFVDHLLDLNHRRQVTVSWSINPKEVIEREEHGTASLMERFEAAKKCVQKGYSIGFHIDPIIWHPNWEKNYKELVRELTEHFEPNQVPYISLGALRFQTEQASMMKQRFSRTSLVNSGEMFRSRDGKLRYDLRLRSKMFKTIIDEFKTYSRAWRVFLCMEAPETWLSTHGSFPKKIDALNELFVPKPKITNPLK